MKLIIGLLVVLIYQIHAYRKLSQKMSQQKVMLYGQKQYWFDQLVDHSNYQQIKYWKQRYWVIQNYFNPDVGSIFLFICGQFVCPGVPANMQWVLVMAQKLQSIVIVTQHRFYGQSLPFGSQSFSLQNLRYLNSQQALSDLAYLIDQFKSHQLYKIKDNPVIAISGSYPGALSAWFRSKYPHLVLGSIASSAVIVAIQDFPEFDQQIFLSTQKSGDWCVNALNDSTKKVETILNSGQGQLLKSFYEGGTKLSDRQFLFFWVDSIVAMVQYGRRTQLCNNLKDKSKDQQFIYLKEYVVKQNSVYEYGAFYLSNESFALSNGQGSRSWYYQSCSEFGFWQTFSKIHPMRSLQLNLDFYKDLCSKSYKMGLWPKVERKNIEYGGLNLKSSNILMSNGIQDPWRWASLQNSQGQIISRIIDCQDCAHIMDLYTPDLKDPQSLKKVRNQQILTVTEWINDYWKRLKANDKISLKFE